MFKFLKRIFCRAIREFWVFVKEVFSGAREEILAHLKDKAKEFVEDLKGSDLADEEKRKQVFKRLTQFAMETGIEVKDHLINCSIELAVAYLKKLGEEDGS